MTAVLCPWCDEPVLDGEELAPGHRQPTHYECGLRAAVGSVGHQRGLCWCYGGTEEDPPWMTRRQAAQAAAAYLLVGRIPVPPPDHQPTKENHEHPE